MIRFDDLRRNERIFVDSRRLTAEPEVGVSVDS